MAPKTKAVPETPVPEPPAPAPQPSCWPKPGENVTVVGASNPPTPYKPEP